MILGSNRRDLKKSLKIRIENNNDLIFDEVFSFYPISIGRSEKCDIALSEFDFISRQHAVITVENNQLKLVDLKSANGIYQNGLRIQEIPIKEKNIFQIGDLTFHVQKLSLASKPPPTPKIDKTMLAPIETLDLQEQYEVQEQIAAGFDLDIPDKNPIKKGPASAMPKAPLNLPKNIPLEPQGISGGANMLAVHPQVDQLGPKNRVLEGYVVWKDQIFDSKLFYPQSKISIGNEFYSDLNVPQIRGSFDLAVYSGIRTLCIIPKGADAELQRGTEHMSLQDLVQANIVKKDKHGFVIQIDNQDLLKIHVNQALTVQFRYGPAPKLLTRTQMLDSTEEIKRTTLISGIVHLFLMILFALNPPSYDAPKLKDIPKRYAKLLVKPPKQIIKRKPKVIEKKEKPKPKEPQPKKKVVRKKVQKRPKKVVLKPNKNLKKINKLPAKRPDPKPKVKELGALAALGALKPMPNQKQAAVNINKNAGGSQKSLNTSKIVAGLKSNSGKLASSGNKGVETKGLGVGSGKGFGTQGLKGGAGARGVGGAVIGSPKLASVGKTEGLTRDQVMKTLSKYIGKIQRCYERSLFDNPNLKGRSEYQWEISPAGRVQWVKVIKTDMSGADSLNSCVKKVFLSMKFPRAKNGQSTVPNIGFPFGRL